MNESSKPGAPPKPSAAASTKETSMDPKAPAFQARGNKSKDDLRLESHAKLVSELQMDNMKLRKKLKDQQPSDTRSRSSNSGSLMSKSDRS